PRLLPRVFLALAVLLNARLPLRALGLRGRLALRAFGLIVRLASRFILLAQIFLTLPVRLVRGLARRAVRPEVVAALVGCLALRAMLVLDRLTLLAVLLS